MISYRTYISWYCQYRRSCNSSDEYARCSGLLLGRGSRTSSHCWRNQSVCKQDMRATRSSETMRAATAVMDWYSQTLPEHLQRGRTGRTVKVWYVRLAWETRPLILINNCECFDKPDYAVNDVGSQALTKHKPKDILQTKMIQKVKTGKITVDSMLSTT